MNAVRKIMTSAAWILAATVAAELLVGLEMSREGHYPMAVTLDWFWLDTAMSFVLSAGARAVSALAVQPFARWVRASPRALDVASALLMPMTAAGWRWFPHLPPNTISVTLLIANVPVLLVLSFLPLGRTGRPRVPTAL